MWWIFDGAGVFCSFATYATVIVVQIGFLRIGLWEGLLAGDPYAYLNLAVFQYHCVLIFTSHIKCMLSEPGVLEKDYEELDLALMAPQLINAVQSVKQELKKVTLEEELESKDHVEP